MVTAVFQDDWVVTPASKTLSNGNGCGLIVQVMVMAVCFSSNQTPFNFFIKVITVILMDFLNH